EEHDLADEEPDDAAERAADDERLVARRRQPHGLERSRVHLVSQAHGHGPERCRDKPTDDPTQEDESREVLRTDRGVEPDGAPADRERGAEQERWDDALIERRKDLRDDRDAVARLDHEVLLPDCDRGAQLLNLYRSIIPLRRA